MRMIGEVILVPNDEWRWIIEIALPSVDEAVQVDRRIIQAIVDTITDDDCIGDEDLQRVASYLDGLLDEETTP